MNESQDRSGYIWFQSSLGVIYSGERANSLGQRAAGRRDWEWGNDEGKDNTFCS